MTEYRRYRIAAATWFFTVNLAERKANRLLIDRIEALRAAFAKVKAKHPFDIDAIVILPDHLHCVDVARRRCRFLHPMGANQGMLFPRYRKKRTGIE
jgi:REP element-mobilizing transposase RayT